ncbi:MAG: sigma-70 family RNA polymerase sigma factor [Deltaproteobacteria bacterium]|nr:sigma-70 family RNA polymerase sigma factor [Deltaproteobacteria bacterium]
MTEVTVAFEKMQLLNSNDLDEIDAVASEAKQSESNAEYDEYDEYSYIEKHDDTGYQSTHTDEHNKFNLFFRRTLNKPLLTAEDEIHLAKELESGKRQIIQALEKISTVYIKKVPLDTIKWDEIENLIAYLECISAQRHLLEHTWTKHTSHPNCAKPSRELGVACIATQHSSFSWDANTPACDGEMELSELDVLLQQIRQGHRRIQMAKNQMVESNLRLVTQMAFKHKNIGLPLMDLIQEGSIGLMKAAEKFNHRKGCRFSTYACWWIRQSILRALSDQSRTVRIPAYVVAIINRVNNLHMDLIQQHGRPPTRTELAEVAGISESQMIETYKYAENIMSLDMHIDEEEEMTDMMDFIASDEFPRPDVEATAKVAKEQLDEVMEVLGQRAAKILRLRFGFDDGDPKTLGQIGAILGITRERVRQIETDALNRLRHPARKRILRELLED